MTIELVAIFILCTALAITLSAYDRRMREIQHLRKIREEIEEKARRRASGLIEEAKERTVSIIAQAVKEAIDNKKEMTSQLQEVSGEHISEYKDKLHTIANDILTNIEKEATGFTRSLQEETIEAQKVLGERFREKYAQLEIELAGYREQKREEIKNQLGEYLKQVAIQVMNGAFTEDEQDKLIIRALEEAKEAHVI